MSPNERRPDRGLAARSPVFAGLAARIQTFALSEGLDVGDRLPSERELARRLEVSRTSLREALAALRIEGVIEVQHGSGTYLLDASAARRSCGEPGGAPRS